MTNFLTPPNNASTTLAASASPSATSLTIASATNFPSSIPSGTVLPLTLNDAATRLIFEVVYVTAISGTTLTVERGQEGTSAQSWGVGDYAYSAATSGFLSALGSGNGQTYAADTGSANAYVAAFQPVLTTYIIGLPMRVKIANANTGASTFNGGPGVVSIIRRDGSALIGNELIVGQIATFISNGSAVILQGVAPATAAAITAGTDTQSAVTPAQLASFVVPAVPGTFKNLNGVTTSNAARSWTADALVVANSSGNAKLLTAVSVSYATGTTGANGYDGNGALGTSQWLYDFVIWNPTTSTTAALCSHSATAPTLPSGYTYFARVGACYLDSSGNLMRVLQRGNKARYQVTAATNTAALPTAASGAQSQWTAVSLAAFVPSTAAAADLLLSSTASNTNWIYVAPNNSYTNTFAIGSAFPQTVNNAGVIVSQVLLESSSVYIESQTNSALYVYGWEDNL